MGAFRKETIPHIVTVNVRVCISRVLNYYREGGV